MAKAKQKYAIDDREKIMSDLTTKDLILGKTLYTLVEKHGVTPAEIGQIRLPHLFLAGKSPSINFTPEGSQEAKIITLDMETHRALVNWLVNRPDSVSDFLFPGQGAEAITPADIQEAIKKVEGLPLQNEQPTGSRPVAMPEVNTPPSKGNPEGASYPGEDSSSKPVRPPSRPETSAPPWAGAGRTPSAPPPTAPEEDKPISKKSPPVPPARPIAPPPKPPEPLVAPVNPSKAVPAIKKEEPKPAPTEDTTKASITRSEIKKEAKADIPATKPEEKTAASLPKKESVKTDQPSKEPVKTDRPSTEDKKGKPVSVVTQRPVWARFFIPGIVIIVVLLCGGCLIGGWFAAQSESGNQLLASLGWSSDTTPEPEASPKATEETIVSVVATPTLPPTNTPVITPTAAISPTDAATPTLPPPTNTPAVTDTPTPTNTPLPTDTPKTEKVEEEPATPTDTPTPGLKYPAPELIEPKNNFAYIFGNTIVLRWKPADLAADERYAVRLVYPYQGQPTYQGTSVTEPEWSLPLDLFGKIDGPDNRYEWFVVIERINSDGSGTAVSPESEHRAFTWR